MVKIIMAVRASRVSEPHGTGTGSHRVAWERGVSSWALLSSSIICGTRPHSFLPPLSTSVFSFYFHKSPVGWDLPAKVNLLIRIRV